MPADPEQDARDARLFREQSFLVVGSLLVVPWLVLIGVILRALGLR